MLTNILQKMGIQRHGEPSKDCTTALGERKQKDTLSEWYQKTLATMTDTVSKAVKEYMDTHNRIIVDRDEWIKYQAYWQANHNVGNTN